MVKNRIIFLYLLSSAFILFLGIFFFLMSGDDYQNTQETNATEITMTITVTCEISDTYDNPSYSRKRYLIAEDGSEVDPCSPTLKVNQSHTCIGSDTHSSEGGGTLTWADSSVTVTAHAYTFWGETVTLSVNLSLDSSRKNEHFVYTFDKPSFSITYAGFGGHTKPSYSAVIKIRPDYWYGSFNLNYGSGSNFETIKQTNYRYWDLPTKIPTRDGYVFAGWYTSQNGGSQVTNNTLFLHTKNQTLYAHWVPVLTKVTYDSNGANMTNSSLLVSGETNYDYVEYNQEYFQKRNLYNPSRSKIEVPNSSSRFYLENSNTFVCSLNQSVSNVSWFNFTQPFSGMYQANKTYTVVFDIVSNSFPTNSVNIVLTSTYDIGNTPQDVGTGQIHCDSVRNGGAYKIFKTWTVRNYSTSENLPYDLRSYIYVPSYTTGTLKFRIAIFPGIINQNNYEYVNYEQKVDNNPTMNITRTGYTFMGWCTDKNGENMIESSTKMVSTTSISIYALCTPNGYSLVADLNEPNTGTFLNKVKWTLPSGWSTASDKSYASKTITYDTQYGTLPTPSREGYTFKGWYDTSSSSGGTKVSSSTIMKAGVCGWSSYTQKATIYARWTVNSYTITFNKNSGTDGTNSVTATYDKAMPSITIPKRTGYSFAGYYDKEQDDYGAGAGGTQYYKADGTSARLWDKDANTTLYARWLPRTDYQVDINILSPSGAQDYQSGTMTQTYGSQTFTGTDQGFNNITFKESWTISNIVPTNGMVLTSVSANAGTLVDNGNGTYTFTANFNNDPSGTWDAVITIQMGDTWAMYAQTPTNGTGSASSPYIIDTPGKLAWISSQLLNNSKGLHYKQTKPIDMSGHYWYPIGASGRTFTGNYNGQGYAITNLYTSPNMIVEGGLFGYVESGIIENVVILSADIQGGSDIGIIAGINNGGTIRNCYVEGNVTATERGVSSNKYSIGGIVGYAPNGTVSSSYYKGLLRGTGNRWYGLMIGYGENATLNDSIGETSLDTAYYNNTVSVDSCLYTYQKQSVIAKRYYAGTFRNWVVSSGRALPTGLTWVGTAGDKVTSISQIQALGYSSM